MFNLTQISICIILAPALKNGICDFEEKRECIGLDRKKEIFYENHRLYFSIF